MQFLGYIVLNQGIQIEDEKIEAIKDWPEPKSMQNIQVFIGFANFYWRFIWSFNKIVALLTSMLKTTGSSGSAPRLGVDDNEVIAGSDKADDWNLSKIMKNVKSEI